MESNDDQYDRHMEDVPIAEEIPSQPNKSDRLANHFSRLNTRFDSMDALLINYGEQFVMLNSRIGNVDDQLIRMETDQERYIQECYATYSVPLRRLSFCFRSRWISSARIVFLLFLTYLVSF